MIEALFSIALAIVWIVVGTSLFKLHPFLVLFSAALALAFLLGIPAMESLLLLQKGFGNLIQNIGLLILFGTIIGVALEKSKATLAIANGILLYVKRLPLPYAVSLMGYLISIPVFCDAAFVILSQLNKTLAKKTKTPLIGLTVALSTGLFAPHVLVPPTPGPLAAASNLHLANLALLIAMGALVALVLVLVGAAYGHYLAKKNIHRVIETPAETESSIDTALPKFRIALAPILVPILLMCFGTIIDLYPETFAFLKFVRWLTTPTMALAIGMVLSFLGSPKNKRAFINEAVSKGIQQAAPILLITGMGGALGSILSTVPLGEYAQGFSSFDGWGLCIPFLIAALLKTAQGSSTVAIITASSILYPLLPLFGLDSEMGKVWAILAIGVGSMTVSHANDSYFWIVTQMGGLDVKTAYRSHTIGTLLQGIVGLATVLIGYTLWLWFR